MAGSLWAGSSDPRIELSTPASLSLRDTTVVPGCEKTWRVLLVDHDAGICKLSRVVWELLGCHCQEAVDGQTALAAVLQGSFDLILLDLGLPDLDGYTVCRHLRQPPACPTQKVIVVSGHGDQNELAEALRRGADDHIHNRVSANTSRTVLCQYIPNSRRATIAPKSDPPGGNLMSRQSVRPSVVTPW